MKEQFITKVNNILNKSVNRINNKLDLNLNVSEVEKYIWDNVLNNKKTNIKKYNIFPENTNKEIKNQMIKFLNSFNENTLMRYKKHDLHNLNEDINLKEKL